MGIYRIYQTANRRREANALYGRRKRKCESRTRDGMYTGIDLRESRGRESGTNEGGFVRHCAA